MSAGRGDLALELAGQTVRLMPERAVLWIRESTLIVADPHFGKAAAFRAGGVPVPAGTTADGLHRLNCAVDRTGATRVVFLGDFLHARAGRARGTMGALAAWRSANPKLKLLLIRGNHDRAAGDPPEELGVECAEPPWRESPFVLSHRPAPADGAYVLAGHLHPGVRLAGPGRQRERLPCFWLTPECGILPAFGDFTGLAPIEPAPADQVYAVAAGHVVRLQRGTGDQSLA